MKPKKSPEPPFEPFVRPPEIEAMRNKLRAHLPEYVDEDVIYDEPAEASADCSFISHIQVIRVDDDGFRKIVAPDGAEYDYLEDDDNEDEDTPENNEPVNYEYDTSGAFTIRSGTEWYAQNDDLLPEAQLFGDLWMQNDLCIMFADTNVGKSILAVQLADSVSRGLPIPGFGFTAEPAPVLYFDFELSDYQFRARYSSAETGKYPFTAGFHRATLNDYSPKQRRFKTFEQFISNEIENALLACKAKTLIIDNISCLRYGTHNTAGALNLMQYLQGIKRTYKISILVLAHTPKRNPTKPISRNDLQGSKMLINLADSAFAIGESRQQPGLKYLKQIKQRGAPETHGADNVCLGRIARTGSFMHFTFAGHSHESDHLAPQTEQYRRSTENRIAELHRQNYSVRKIAAQLGLAPTTIFRALKKLDRCGKEEDECADMQMCGCADEEMPTAESVEENQYLAIQLQAPALCDYELIVCSSKAFMSSFVGSLPPGGCREGFSKLVTSYEPLTRDAPKTSWQCCHTEALEVRPKPLTSYEAQSDDDQNAPLKCCHTEAQACPEVTRREVRPKPVYPYEPQPHDAPKAPARASGSPLERGRGVFSKPVPPYEAQSHDNQNAPQCCHTEALEVRPKPLTSYEAKSHDDQKATNHPKATSMPQPTNHPTSIIEIIIPPQKPRNPKTNSAPKIPGYKPEGGFLTIDDEIEGLTYLQKYAPLIFNGEYEARLQLLKKIKEGLFDG